MFGSAIVDVAIGLVFVYFLLSVIASHVDEFIAKGFKWRAKDLEYGVYRMLGDDDLTHRLFDHPLIGARLPTGVDDQKLGALLHQGSGPSYIDPKMFTLALLDTVFELKAPGEPRPHTVDAIREIVAKLPDGLPARDALLTSIDHAENDLRTMRGNVEHWFNSSMDRLEGVYRRRLMVLSAVTAACVCIVIGVDTIAIATTLWQEQGVRAAVAGAGAQATTTGLEDANNLLSSFNLPLGWTTLPTTFAGWALKVLGVLVSIAAVSLGAPFWFDVLQRISNLRATGTEPKPKKTAP